MNVLLLIAHGSRMEAANQEVRELAARLEQLQSSASRVVVPAFLEFAKPDIGSGIDQCVELGASNITVVPYFLTAGAHVNRDIPAQLASAGLRHPNIEFNLTRHVGAVDNMLESIIKATAEPQGQ